MPLAQIDLHHPDVLSECMRVLHSDFPVLMLQLPSVFALVAPSTDAGVHALNVSKNRLSGKQYGSAIGDSNRFLDMAIRSSLPEAFANNPEAIHCMEGAFIRLKIADIQTESASVTKGTHQGLLLSEGKERELFRGIELAFTAEYPNPIFGGAHYYAPICTSANISGDPNGSIVDLERAVAFAQDREIQLLIINSNVHAEETGSYPIFEFDGNTVRVTRHGPNQERILRSLPSTMVVA
jgi:hypothetical protein